MASIGAGNVDFKGRVRAAVQQVHAEFNCLDLQGQELFTCANRSGKYGWMHLMDTDGLLVAERRVESHFDGDLPTNQIDLRIAVAVQSEDKTALTKPNPFGKAAVGGAPLGIWADLRCKDGRQRVRLDRLYVLFLIPESLGTNDHDKLKEFDAAKRAVQNARDANRDCRLLIVPRGISAQGLTKQMIDALKGTLRGLGRPPKEKS